MPSYDYQCPSGHVSEIKERMSQVKDRIRCREKGCHRVAIRIYTFANAFDAQRFTPIVVFRKPDGTYSIPGQNGTRTPRDCVRVELTSFAQIRQVTESMNGRTRAQYERQAEGQAEFYASARSSNRSDLRAAMRRMSPRGRALAELAMKKTDSRRKSTEMPTAFFEVMEYDASSRLPHRDLNTGWKERGA